MKGKEHVVNVIMKKAEGMGYKCTINTNVPNIPGIEMITFETQDIEDRPVYIDLVYRSDVLVSFVRKWRAHVFKYPLDTDVLSVLETHKELLDVKSSRAEVDKLQWK